ncbi:MAG: peptide ABC transporter substrate-binding protein [Firmicutes bacterium]|nr:peptide ABC transporter substrate-binding protein [Bacillota bacterium]
MRAVRLWAVILLGCFLVVAGVAGVVAKENVVQLPFFDNIPSFIPFYWQAQHILAQGTIFEGLFGYAPAPKGLGGVKVVPVLAEKWTCSEDGKTWTFTLRKDKKWSNGDPVTARDFEWTYQYVAGPSLPDVPMWASPLQFIENAWGVKSGALPPNELGVKALDDYTLQIKLATPRYDFNCWLVAGAAMPLHRKTVEKFGNDWWKPGNFVGNGPYTPVSWTDRKEAVLVKNKNYVGECGNVDRIILKNFPAGASQLQAYQAGELDLAWIGNVAEYKFVQSNAQLKKAFHETLNDLFWSGYQVSRGFNEVMDNKKLRQAFAMAIDRDTLARTVLAGRAVGIGKFWTDNDPIGKKLKAIPYNPAQAKKLLAEAGYPGGKGLPTLKFYITGNMPEVEFIVDQWKKNLGVNVLIENIESGLYWNQYVWANWTPEAAPGFTRISGPMNFFESGALLKNACHTLWYYDYPSSVRKKSYELYQLREDYLTKEGGLTAADWQPLLEKKEKLLAAKKEIVAKEPSKYWVAEMMQKPTFDEQFDEVYEKWKKAATDKEKTEAWRQANRILLGEEQFQVEYNGMSETNKQGRRLRYEMLNTPFDKAIEIAPKTLQILQDQYYMVPLYMDKAQYVQRPNIQGLMIYKFSWGPAVFNFKYMNVK